MSIKAVLFDCDGTVIDTNQLIMNAWQCVAKMLNPNMQLKKEDVARFFGQTLEDATTIIAKENNIENVDLVKASKVYWDYHTTHHNEIVGTFPQIKDTLNSLKKLGIKLGIVTSGSNNNCEIELDECGILKYFDAIVGSDNTKLHKPDPFPALLCCKMLNVNPSEAIMVGDSRHDIACGNRAGCKTVFVSWSFCNDAKNLNDDEKPDYIINQASELLNLI